MPCRISKEIEKVVIDSYLANKTVEEISANVKIGTATVHNIIKRNNIPLKSKYRTGLLNNGIKICYKCKIEKPFDDFFKHKGKTAGLSSHCKICDKAAQKERYSLQKNKDKRNAYGRKRYAKNKTKNREYSRKWRAENKEKSRNTQRKYKATHQNEIKAYRKRTKKQAKIRNDKWNANNRERKLKTSREYYYKNRDRIIQYQKEYSKKNRSSLNKRNRERIKEDPNFKLRHALAGIVRNAIKYQSAKKSDHTMILIGCSLSFIKLRFESQFKNGMTWENYGTVWEIDHIIPSSLFDLKDSEHQIKCCHYTNLQPLWATTRIAKEHGDFKTIGNTDKGNKILYDSLSKDSLALLKWLKENRPDLNL